MSRKDDAAVLADMIDAAERVARYTAGITEDLLAADTMRTDAVLRVLGVMGEAVTRVSPETQTRFPAVAWAKMKAMRNLLIHRYDRIDISIVWETVSVAVPATLHELRNIQQQLFAERPPPAAETP